MSSISPIRATHELQPFRSVTQADSVGGRRLPGAFTLPRVNYVGAYMVAASTPAEEVGLCRPTPAKPGQYRRAGRRCYGGGRLLPVGAQLPYDVSWGCDDANAIDVSDANTIDVGDSDSGLGLCTHPYCGGGEPVGWRRFCRDDPYQ